jgi:hypothetical protein
MAHLSLSVVSKPACSLSRRVYGNPLGGQSGHRHLSFCFSLPLESVFMRREGSTVGGDGVRQGGEEWGECSCGIWDGAVWGDSFAVRSVKHGGVRSWHAWEDPVSENDWCRSIGRGGGDLVGKGGRDGIGSGMVRLCGETRRTSNSYAFFVKGGTGFPGPQ